MGEKGFEGKYEDDGGRYVMPVALWTPAMSIFAGMKEMVTSPGVPPFMIGWMPNLMTESGFFSYSRNEWTISGLKNLKPRIFLAAAGSARMVVMGDVGSNWRKVASWQ
jgi:hypothetical protein